jgi:hypothetical protein
MMLSHYIKSRKLMSTSDSSEGLPQLANRMRQAARNRSGRIAAAPVTLAAARPAASFWNLQVT